MRRDEHSNQPLHPELKRYKRLMSVQAETETCEAALGGERRSRVALLVLVQARPAVDRVLEGAGFIARAGRGLLPGLEAAERDDAPVLVLVLAHAPSVVVRAVQVELLSGVMAIDSASIHDSHGSRLTQLVLETADESDLDANHGTIVRPALAAAVELLAGAAAAAAVPATAMAPAPAPAIPAPLASYPWAG